MEGETQRQLNVRVPAVLCDWLTAEKARNKSSLSSEVTRALRERQERTEQERVTRKK